MQRQWKLRVLAFALALALAACETPRTTPTESTPPKVPSQPTSVARSVAPADAQKSEALQGNTAPVDAAKLGHMLADLLKVPLRRHVTEFGATKNAPAFSFTIELPEHYTVLMGKPDDMSSTQTYGGTTSFHPSFTLMRTTIAAPADHIYDKATVTRGTRGGAPWLVQVKAGEYAVLTAATVIVTTTHGRVECRAYVDTVDRTPIHDWMIDRCLTVIVR